jgi:hypothetical protein
VARVDLGNRDAISDVIGDQGVVLVLIRIGMGMGIRIGIQDEGLRIRDWRLA